MGSPPIAVSALTSWATRVCLLGFYGAFAYFLWLSRRSPTGPSEETGHVIELNNHGNFFYVRQEDAWLFYGGLALIPVTIAALALLQWRFGKAALESSRPDSAFWRYLNWALLIALTIYMFWP